MSSKIHLIKGDITQMKVAAIVNAANHQLKGGGGVDGAIHRAGGPEILEQCLLWVAENGTLPTGQAMITTAGKMPAKYVIHTVGPVWNGGNKNERELLANAYRNSLQLAAREKLTSVAFPNISTGVYGFPKEEAAEIAVETVKETLLDLPAIQEVHFVCFGEENYRIYQRILGEE